jgi:hypothetical protein
MSLNVISVYNIDLRSNLGFEAGNFYWDSFLTYYNFNLFFYEMTFLKHITSYLNVIFVQSERL